MIFKRYPKFVRPLASIRTQLMGGFGIILFLVLVLIVIDYLSLRALQNSVETTFKRANRMRELSLEIENEFLLARQSEGNFLSDLQVLGLEAAVDTYVTANQEHLDQARLGLAELEQLLQVADNPALQQVLLETSELAPLLDAYEAAFLATVDLIQQRNRADGVEQTLQRQLSELEAVTASFSATRLQPIILEIRANEQAYFNTGQQQYIDNIRLLIQEFNTVLAEIPSETWPVGNEQVTAAELSSQVAAYFSTFNRLVELERDIEINTTIFRDITMDINALTARIGESGENGLVLAERQLQSINLRSTLAVLLMGSLALSLGGGLALILARRIISRLDRLSEVARQFGRGHLEATIPVTGRDELAMLAAVFNDMAAQLRDLIGSLEEQVARRTRRLATVAVLSERLTAILHLEELLSQIVNQVKAEFDYYHTHIYLLDEQQGRLLMVAGTGQAGAKMKADRYQIPLEASTSLVARAARSGQVVRVDNVREAPDWLPNPLLPETYSEMAVPIILEGEVVGVLDVQEDKMAGLDEGDANLLRLLADQVAVAIRNARLFEEVEAALQEAHRLQERYLQQAWDKSRTVETGGRHLYARPGASPLDEQKQQALTTARQAALTQNNPAVVSGVDGQAGARSLAAPINLRDQTVGSLQLYSETDQAWSQEDLAVIEVILEQLAQAADNLRLFDEIRSRAGREQTIREITEHMQQATNLEELVKITASELGDRLAAGHAVVELGLVEEPATGSQSVKR